MGNGPTTHAVTQARRLRIILGSSTPPHPHIPSASELQPLLHSPRARFVQLLHSSNNFLAGSVLPPSDLSVILPPERSFYDADHVMPFSGISPRWHLNPVPCAMPQHSLLPTQACPRLFSSPENGQLSFTDVGSILKRENQAGSLNSRLTDESTSMTHGYFMCSQPDPQCAPSCTPSQAFPSSR